MKFNLDEDGNVVLTAKQEAQFPYVVLVDAAARRGAAFNRHYQLVIDEVSPGLLTFAMDRPIRAAAWNDEDDHRRLQRASWMPAGSLSGWTLRWVREDGSSLAHLCELPMN